MYSKIYTSYYVPFTTMYYISYLVSYYIYIIKIFNREKTFAFVNVIYVERGKINLHVDLKDVYMLTEKLARINPSNALIVLA